MRQDINSKLNELAQAIHGLSDQEADALITNYQEGIHWAFTTKGSYEYRIAYLNELQARIDFIRTVRKLNKVQVEETLMLSKRVAERKQSEESKAIFNILTEKKP